MAKFDSVGKWAVIGVVAVIVIIVAVMYRGGAPAPSPISPAPASSSTPDTSTPSSSPTTNNPQPSTPSAPAIHFVTPVMNDEWKLNVQNPIAWDREGVVTGEIDLIDAKTKSVVGVILSETGPHQTSYTWDTRQIYLARYNPLKKDILVGTYQIRIKFDGNNLPTITSPSFTVTK